MPITLLPDGFELVPVTLLPDGFELVLFALEPQEASAQVKQKAVAPRIKLRNETLFIA